jgi:hypothetical protein
MTAGTLRDPTVAVKLARELLLGGRWKTAPRRGDPIDRAVYVIRANCPAALSVLGRSAVAGLLRPPPDRGCSWCTATLWAAASLGDDPPPEVNDHTELFLGSRCARCRRRHLAAEVARRERGHVAAIVASGLYPSASRRLRTPEQVAAHAKQAAEYGAYTRRVLRAATAPGRRRPGELAPTGAIWAVKGR